MKRIRIGSWLFALLIILAILLSACGSEAIPETINSTVALDPGSSAAQGPGSPNLSYAVAENLDAAFNTFLDAMVGYNAINPAGLNEMLAEEPPPFLLDVRSINEVEENGYIEGATVIPLLELGKNLDLLPSFDTTIVAYCGSGWRCTLRQRLALYYRHDRPRSSRLELYICIKRRQLPGMGRSRIPCGYRVT